MKHWDLERRALLKRLGVGAACLPLLRVTGAQAQANPTKKLVCVLAIQGYRQMQWKPAPGPLPPQALPAASSPLEPHKRDVIFATGLGGSPGASGHDAYGTIFWGQAPAASATSLYKEPDGKTLDQVVADALPVAAGGRAALTLGVQITLPPRGPVEPGGWICSWKGAGQPVTPQEDPAAVYQELFGSAAPGDPTAFNQLRFQRKSMLDYVGASLQRFASRVGSEDRRAIQAHLEATRGLERRVQGAQPRAQCGQRPPRLELTDHAQSPTSTTRTSSSSWRRSAAAPRGSRPSSSPTPRASASTSAGSSPASRRGVTATRRRSATGTTSPTTRSWTASITR
jgi:hypothetical protein